ncbi:thiol peroxidase [Clostridium botulinum]|uniref:Thiol peroxidase n=1 Tax=Clostridium botulinum TaxID=1491 RepID=A0A6B4JI06_CLOBO|nr:thiol peroxidase [Clostridium botulinum]EES50466.1 putative thiol peroxidase [Clostridium botulinum E1 str. 'BoNT E Beluga']MBY6759886.1 thiol peroxidase [Clostridium botulinum]MBY6918796.1 thiol peroxidase [Clostridium botulinum]MCR1129882.1 thiol peroxidase [Clostridium botulinum]NFH67810.1 thiol peroxidase [Clostridium botulinum]
MNVNFKGNPVTLEGTIIKVGDIAPEFTAIDNSLNSISSKNLKGKKVFVSVPSVDTPVCDLEVKRFNKEATSLADTNIYVISMDLPFAQARWCGSEGVDKVQTLSDYKDREFGKKYGTYIKELGLLTRAIFVVDESGKVIYVEYCEEVSSHPNYDKVLKVLK